MPCCAAVLVSQSARGRILHVVETYTRKQLKDVGSVLKLELIESNDDGQKVHRTLCAGDSVTLPLVFPGPVLKECHVVHLRVTFSEPPVRTWVLFCFFVEFLCSPTAKHFVSQIDGSARLCAVVY